MKILMVAPDCFPVDSAESIVNIKMLQAFAAYRDIEVDLVSRRKAYNTYPSEDISFYGIRVNSVYSVWSYNKLNLRTIWQTLMCFLFFGSAYKGSVWAYVALPLVKKLVNETKYDLILTKSSPSFLIGSYLKKRGIPWVASWNDPFPVNFYPHPYGKDVNHKQSMLERLILRQMRRADYHVFPSSKLMDYMISYLNVDRNKCKVIPHAIIPHKSFFNQLRIKSESNSTMRIIHSGSLTPPRSPLSFFKALEIVLQKHPDYRIKLTIVGHIDDTYVSQKEEFPQVSARTELIGPVDYKTALDIIKNYDLACIIEAETERGKAIFLPTKVTDFIQESIPIITISPMDGVLYDMYKKGIIGYYGDVSDTDSIVKEIEKAYHDYISRGLKNNVVEDCFLPEGIVSAYRDIYSLLSKTAYTSTK